LTTGDYKHFHIVCAEAVVADKHDDEDETGYMQATKSQPDDKQVNIMNL